MISLKLFCSKYLPSRIIQDKYTDRVNTSRWRNTNSFATLNLSYACTCYGTTTILPNSHRLSWIRANAPESLVDHSIKPSHPELMNVGKPLVNHDERPEDRVSGDIIVDV